MGRAGNPIPNDAERQRSHRLLYSEALMFALFASIATWGSARQAGSMNLSRPRHDRVIAGVCAALARRFGWRTRTVRILTALSILLPGPQVIIYLVLWVLIPNDVG